MGTVGKALARRIREMNAAVLSFVEACTEEDWQRTCTEEEWSVGVTARHIGVGHYSAVDLAMMIVAGRPLPEMTMTRIVEMGNEHARRHAGCTREEVAEILKKNGRRLEATVAGLSDEDLDKTGTLALAGGEVTAAGLLELVVLRSGGQHLESMKKAVA